MNAPTPFMQRFEADFARVTALPQPDWLSARRRQSYARFQQRGLPTTRDEEWKYTSLAGLERASMPEPAQANAGTGFDANMFDGLQPLRIRFAAERALPDSELPPGLILMPLAQALAESRPAATACFGSLSEDEAFADFNSALWQDGLYLELAPGVKLAQPLYLQQASGLPLRHLLVLGRDSQATLIQHNLPADNGSLFGNNMNECVLGAAACLTHLEVQEQNQQARLIARSAVQLGTHSQYTHLALSTGGALIRNDLTLRLDGPGAACRLHGLSLGHGRSHIDQRVFVDHVLGGGSSRQLYKSVLWERARTVFNGRVRVAPGATKTDARQTARNLLLSKDAEADSKPQLEIFADDVQCSHGAVTGSLDETQLFYLRTRGLDEAAARKLLVQAFAADVLEALNPQLRAPLDVWLQRQVEARHAA